MLADIANGNTDFADVCYLIALAVFVLCAIGALVAQVPARALTLLVAVGLALLSLAFLVL